MGDNREFHKPVKRPAEVFDQREGGMDPAVLTEAAHVTAAAVLHRGRSVEDPEIRQRLVEFTDTEGLDGLAALWSDAPPVSLPGALWRLYALRSSIQADPVRLSRWFTAGRPTAQVADVVAGVADPPGPEEIRTMANTVLNGAWTGEFDVALERFAAFCRVTALGRIRLEDHEGLDAVRGARKLERTADDLEAAARAWRAGALD
ncbi:hypothetical protein [Kocuria sp.]|uniref:hypothetical protein n=1 Tax=Kocuria sp. TaxID=1871328 RepID=UPI0026E0FC14|nr:hypothetical protein [Kocuria sp.]MDO5617947.1 hypothetical protein [Kocuria sp.]